MTGFWPVAAIALLYAAACGIGGALIYRHLCRRSARRAGGAVAESVLRVLSNPPLVQEEEPAVLTDRATRELLCHAPGGVDRRAFPDLNQPMALNQGRRRGDPYKLPGHPVMTREEAFRLNPVKAPQQTIPTVTRAMAEDAGLIRKRDR